MKTTVVFGFGLGDRVDTLSGEVGTVMALKYDDDVGKQVLLKAQYGPWTAWVHHEDIRPVPGPTVEV
jgi:hypothetical protein